MSQKVIDADQLFSKPRRAYHTPHLTDFGAVNELTRSGIVLNPGELDEVRANDGFLPNY